MLRERLLNGEVREVCAMLKLPLPLGYREYHTDVFAVFTGWYEKKKEPEKMQLPEGFDVYEHVWADDGGHSAFHYLCIGRQRTNYAGWKPRYPLLGVHSPGPPAAESAEGRGALLSMLLSERHAHREAQVAAHGFAPQIRLHQNQDAATPLHFLAATNNCEMLKILMPYFKSGKGWLMAADSLALKDASQLTAAEVALKFGNLPAALALGLDHLQELPASRRTLQNLGNASQAAQAVVSVSRKEQERVDEAKAEVTGTLLNHHQRLAVVAANQRLLSEKLRVSETLAGGLLTKANFNVAKAVEIYNRDHRPPPPPVPPPQGGEGGATLARLLQLQREDSMALTCPVCYDTVSQEERAASVAVTTLICAHFICDTCLSMHAQVRIIEEASLALLVCPAEGCKEQIAAATIQALFAPATPAAITSAATAEIVPAEKEKEVSLPRHGRGEVVEKYEKMLAQAFVDGSRTASWCPSPGCDRCIVLPDQAISLSVAVTCACGTQFCFACKDEPHEPASCKIWEAFNAEREGAKLSGELDSSKWISENTMPCTSCSAPINRTEGCNHMKCTRCRGEFCYACGAVWNNSHYGCARRAAQDDTRQGQYNAQDVRAWCLGGCERWEACIGRQTADYWTRLLGSSFPLAKEVLREAHGAVLEGARVMRHSFAIDLAIPTGVEYAVARRRLRLLRADLEAALYPLADAVALRNVFGMDGKYDLRRPIALAHALETDARLCEQVNEQVAAVRDRARTMIVAGRAGVLTGPSRTVDTVAIFASDAVINSRLTAKQIWKTTYKATTSLFVASARLFSEVF